MNGAELKMSDRLALRRTAMAAERTLMAWVRTALSMISFGFTIFKFLQLMQDQSTRPVLRPDAPRTAGLTLIGIGTFALIVACFQYRKRAIALSPDQAFDLWNLTFIVGCLLGFLGILMFWSIVFNAPPFG